MLRYIFAATALLVTSATSVSAQSTLRPASKPHVWSPGLIPHKQQEPISDPVPPKKPEVVASVSAQQERNQAAEPSLDEGGMLSLVCIGGGTANKLDVRTIESNGSMSGSYNGTGGEFGSFSANGSASSTAYGTRAQGFDDQVNVSLQGNEGRLRMPRTMLPIIHGGSDGWFKLKDISISRDEITASVAVNIINNPKLRIDRYTGSISISGKAGDYSGRCRRLIKQDNRQF